MAGDTENVFEATNDTPVADVVETVPDVTAPYVPKSLSDYSNDKPLVTDDAISPVPGAMTAPIGQTWPVSTDLATRLTFDPSTHPGLTEHARAGFVILAEIFRVLRMAYNDRSPSGDRGYFCDLTEQK